MKPQYFKLSSDINAEYFQRRTRYGDKIKAIPLVYKKIEYKGDPKQICKLPLKGYKCASRVSAYGEYTIEVLNKILRTSNLKLVRGLNFDPYLCEISGLDSLYKILMKFKRFLLHLNTSFRRFTKKDELKLFSPCLGRLVQLEKIKVEFPNTHGIENQNLKDLEKYCRKFACLKSVELKLNGPENFGKNVHRIRGLFHSSLKLKEIKSHVYLYDNEPARPGEVERNMPFKRFFKNVKALSLKYSFRTDWASYFDGADHMKGFQTVFRRFPALTNPIYFSLTFDKMQIHSDVIDAVAEMLPQFTNLKFIVIELNNIKLSELELMTLAKGFVSCKQIEHLTFKYLENVTIFMMDIIQFIMLIAKYSAFPKFDLFFRKLLYQEWQTTEVKNKLDDLRNIQYTLTKQSIHIQKIRPRDMITDQ